VSTFECYLMMMMMMMMICARMSSFLPQVA
jgi:hypothetical protein